MTDPTIPQVALDAPPNKRGRPRRLPEDWTPAFLVHFAQRGNAHTASKAANVAYNTMLRHRRADAAFRARYRLAYREYGAMLAETLATLGIDKGNVIALIASLKAHSDRMAKRYSEKLVDNRVMNVTLHQGSAAPPDALETLARMKRAASLDEWDAMEGAPLALTAPPIDVAEIVPPEEAP